MYAVILAGGFGTRLRTLVSDVPKPMAPIGGKPYLVYLLNYLKTQGISEAVLAVHYMHEKISDYFGTEFAGIKLNYSIEESPLGTGGGIRRALSLMPDNNPCLVLNGDTFTKFQVDDMLAKYNRSKSRIAIAVREVSSCLRYSRVILEGEKAVIFATDHYAGAGYINAGVYMLDKTIFNNYQLPDSFSFEQDFLYRYTPSLEPLVSKVSDYFIDIGVPEDYERACRELPLLCSLK